MGKLGFLNLMARKRKKVFIKKLFFMILMEVCGLLFKKLKAIVGFRRGLVQGLARVFKKKINARVRSRLIN